ncbi:MAG: hypothetical protein DMG34_08270 [Acidobacteria bacterium]|nr:MAG: hypothetical protein DMG34_08270 [Acidobacteriota bacterium]
MKPISERRLAVCARRRSERGYAILLVLFLVTLMLIATISVAPNILTQGRREKETEMIWRGKQYTRAVKLYYRKTGKFPTSMDDLTKPKLGSLRFMRQAYKDPMNKKDGEWRLIYVGPTGQLIGSLKPPQTLQLSGLAGAGGALPGTPAAQLGAQSAGQTPGQTFGQAVGQIFGNTGAAAQSAPSNSANQPNTAGSANSGTATNATSTDAPGTSPDASDAASEALLASDPTTVMGGNIIGVGSTVNQRSIIVYEKAKNYKQFEFIWDPSKDAIVLGGAAGPQIGTPAGQPSNASPFGQPNNSNPNSPGSPLNPQPTPPETTPAPPQQP